MTITCPNCSADDGGWIERQLDAPERPFDLIEPFGKGSGLLLLYGASGLVLWRLISKELILTLSALAITC